MVAGPVWGRVIGAVWVLLLMLTARPLGFDICSSHCILRRPSDRIEQRRDLEEEFLRGTGMGYAEVRVLNSKGQIDWEWHPDVSNPNTPEYIPEKGDVWGNRAKAKAVLGHQAMVFTAYLKGGNNSSARCVNQGERATR